MVVKFDHQVQDNPVGIQYGVDFIVFGNAFYANSGGTAGGCFSEPVNIAVSQNGTDWYDISGVYADTEFPTMGYTDTSSAFAADGTIETDYTQPVDPNFTATGKTLTQLQAGYAGSGGGTGVDFSGTGLSWIQYVKVYQDSGAAGEIDGFADVVPEPVTMSLLWPGHSKSGVRGNHNFLNIIKYSTWRQTWRFKLLIYLKSKQKYHLPTKKYMPY